MLLLLTDLPMEIPALDRSASFILGKGMKVDIELPECEPIGVMSNAIGASPHLTSMLRGFASSTFGSVSERTPSFSSAPILF
jgi:hypothetical protein